MTNVIRKSLNEITMQSIDIVITAVILSKTDPNVFQTKESTEYRSVILFTVRDSKHYITNCKCWGFKDRIDDYHRKFHIHDIIDIICPRVVPIRNNQQEQHFQPAVTLPFQLVLNDGTGFIEKHLGDIKDLTTICKLSIRPLTSVLNLSDINSTNVNFKSHYVDLLVAIAVMKPVKDVRAKSGFPLKCLELVVIDKSLPGGMVLTIWNTAWIERSQQYWKPLKTVLHLIDVKVGYSEFHKKTTLLLSSRSLMFENPIGKEMERVAEYAAGAPSIDMDIFIRGVRDFLPDQVTAKLIISADTITTLLTVKQIYDNAFDTAKDDSKDFTAVLLATVTKFELDGYSSVISRKCKSCGYRMLPEQHVCDNDQCQMNFSFNYSGDKFVYFIDLNIHLSDHTGTLTEGRLSGAAAEQVLKLSADDLIRYSDKQKDVLKWRVLLERHEVKIFVKKTAAVRPNLIIQVVDMKKLSLKEFSERIVVY